MFSAARLLSCLVFFLNRKRLWQQASNVAATILPAKNLQWQTWQQKYSWKQNTVKTQGQSVKLYFQNLKYLQCSSTVLRGRCRTHFFVCVLCSALSFCWFIGMGSIIVCNVFFFLFIDRIDFKGWGKPIGENKISAGMDFKQKLYAYVCLKEHL